MMKEAPEYLRRKDAAAYLNSRYGIGSPAWLAKLVTLGGGPAYTKAGNTPLYRMADLDEWMQGRMTQRASSSVTRGAGQATALASAKPSGGTEPKGNPSASDTDQNSEAAA